MSTSKFQTTPISETAQLQYRVRLAAWRYGFQKITATKLIRVYTQLDLVDSKSCVDNCLNGRESILIPKSEQDARALAAELHRCGAVVRLEEPE
jgi:ribosomal protein L7/L12